MPAWRVFSKAFSRSKHTSPVLCPFSNPFSAALLIRKILSCVEWLGLKSAWFLYYIFFLSVLSLNRLFIICSRIRLKKLKIVIGLKEVAKFGSCSLFRIATYLFCFPSVRVISQIKRTVADVGHYFQGGSAAVFEHL